MDNCANSEWWSTIISHCHTLGITPIINNIMSRRQTWRDAPEEDTMKALRAQCKDAISLLNRQIDSFEETWFQEKLSNSTKFLNRPGKGCVIFRKATVPGAQTLIRLHYDFNEHYRRHPLLTQFDHPCTTCHLTINENNTHTIFHCSGGRLDPDSLHKFRHAIKTITSLYYEHAYRIPKEDYLGWLTKNPKQQNGTNLTLEQINDIARASLTLHLIRTTQRCKLQANLTSTYIQRRPTEHQRIEQCRDLMHTSSPVEFDNYLLSIHAALISLKGGRWKPAWKEAQTLEGIDSTTTAKRFHSLLKDLQKYGPYLCLAGSQRRDLFREEVAISKPTILQKLTTIWRQAQDVPWMANLPIWQWLHTTPLAAAWILEPRPMTSKHHEITGANHRANIPKLLKKELTNDLRNAFHTFENISDIPTPMFQLTVDGKPWKQLNPNARTSNVRIMITRNEWYAINPNSIAKRSYFIIPDHPVLERYKTEIREQVKAQLTSQPNQATALARAWLADLLTRAAQR